MKEEYWKLRSEVESHPGFLYLQSRKVHDKSLRIFGGNFRDLAGLLGFVENPDTYLRSEVNEKKREEIFFELQRFFHNYVASAESLVSHTRSYVRHRHENDHIGVAFHEKVKQMFAEHLPTAVIKDFRNYFLHKGLPVSSINETFNVDTNGPPEIKILLSVDRLLKWKKWSSPSKRYLRGQGDQLQISHLVAEYHNNVVAFYRWFDELLDEEHRKDVEQMQSIASRVTAMEKAQR